MRVFDFIFFKIYFISIIIIIINIVVVFFKSKNNFRNANKSWINKKTPSKRLEYEPWITSLRMYQKVFQTFRPSKPTIRWRHVTMQSLW